MLPGFVIIGAQKAATTLVHEMLSAHAGVFMPNMEVPFFEDPDYGGATISSLSGLFDRAGQNALCGIRRPSYLAKPECPERLSRDLPGVRLIAVLRDPVDRAISAHAHNVRYGFAPLEQPAVAMPKLIADAYASQWPRSREIIEFGFYGRQISHYLEFFDRSRLLFVLHESVRRDPEGVFRNLCAFLGLPPSAFPSIDRRRANVGFRSVPRLYAETLKNRFRFRYSDDRQRLYARQQTVISRGICRALDLAGGLGADLAPGWTLNTDPGVVAQLRKIYADDILLTQDLTGLDLSHWLAADHAAAQPAASG